MTNTTEEKTLGILLPCPCCGEVNATIPLCLSNASMHCEDCEADFDLDTIKAIMARWGKVVKWIEAMPSNDE